MSSQIGEVTVKVRRDTAGNWTSSNPTPLAGEWCYETDTGKAKIGDGSTAWTSLAYIAYPLSGSGIVTATQYDTGWVANSDWTNSALTVTHSLNTSFVNLQIEVFLSSSNTIESDFRKVYSSMSDSDTNKGINLRSVDLDSFNINTSTGGILYISAAGTLSTLSTQSWYYRAIVTKLTIN